MKFKFIIMLLFISTASYAEEMKLKYDLYWSGFRVGEMNLDVKEDKNQYSYLAKIDTHHIVKYFTNYWSNNHSIGKIKNNKLIPEKYVSTWNRKKHRQTLEVLYEPSGNVAEVKKTPEDRKKHPEVDKKLKFGTYDPVTAGFFSRKKVKEIVESGTALPAKFTTPIYDAKRRFDVEHEIVGYEIKDVNGENQKLLHIKFKRTPIAGFRANELERIAEGEDPMIHFFLNADYIPVWGYGESNEGTATIKLAEIVK